MQRGNRRLGAKQIRRSHLHGRRAQRHRRGNSPAIANSARRDDRNFHRIDDLRDERERTALRRQVGRQEHAAVAASLDALGNDGVDSMVLEPARLRDRRRGAEDHAARGFEAINQGFLRQAEMKADDFRLQLHDGSQSSAVKGGGIEAGKRQGRRQTRRSRGRAA